MNFNIPLETPFLCLIFFTITQRLHFCNCMGEVVRNYSRNIDSDDGYLQLSGRGGASRGEYGSGHVAPAYEAGRFRGYLPIVRGEVGAPMIWSRSAPLPSLVSTPTLSLSDTYLIPNLTLNLIFIDQ